MAAKLDIVLGELDEDREIRSEDFAPWSYNLHYLSSDEPWTYRYHRHFGCFELVYVIEGSVEHLLEGVWSGFSRGDLLAIGEEDFHAIRGSSFAYANLILPVRFWDSWVESLGLEDPLGNPRRCRANTVNIPVDQRDAFENLLDRLFRYQQTHEGERQLRRFLGGLFFQVYWEEGSNEPGRDGSVPETPANHPRWWADLVRLVEASPELPEGPRELADLAGRSREHVARSCRRYLNCSPSAWLNELRLERAALQLRKTNRTISDIVYSLDFGNLPHFYRLFKRRFGLPPGAFRRMYGDTP